MSRRPATPPQSARLATCSSFLNLFPTRCSQAHAILGIRPPAEKGRARLGLARLGLPGSHGPARQSLNSPFRLRNGQSHRCRSALKGDGSRPTPSVVPSDPTVSGRAIGLRPGEDRHPDSGNPRGARNCADPRAPSLLRTERHSPEDRGQSSSFPCIEVAC